ncbi:MAG: putative F420-dependent oxidoreductase, partial [Thermomicrobiales bacterium]|nr:putative F420-dependent oxidoreductase [Thermomicrobiales bacterium]
GPRMLDLTARYADGWNTWFSGTGNTVAGLLPLLEKVDAACEAAGRDPTTLERSAAVIVEVGPHEPSAMTGPPLTGSAAEIAAGLRAYAGTGISHVQVWLEPNTPTGIEAFAPVLEELNRG